MYYSEKIYSKFVGDMDGIRAGLSLKQYPELESLSDEYLSECIGELIEDMLRKSESLDASETLQDALYDPQILSLIALNILRPSSDNRKQFLNYVLEKCKKEFLCYLEEPYEQACKDHEIEHMETVAHGYNVFETIDFITRTYNRSISNEL